MTYSETHNYERWKRIAHRFFTIHNYELRDSAALPIRKVGMVTDRP